MKNLFYCAILIAFAVACNQPSTNTDTPKESTKTEAPKVKGTPMESVPYEDIKNLFDNCDYIDYVFYNTNFSISQNEKASIQSAISHISKSPASLNPNCKAIGRIFYQIDGKNAMEADMYFQEGCTYYVFLINNKPAYANMMTDDGIGYMQNIISRASTVGGQ